MIVEDDEGVLEMLEAVFEKQYEVYTAENGIVAYEMFFQIRPNIIVTDVVMPKMDGADLTKKIKLVSPETAIFALSGAGQERLNYAFDMGANKTFEKPGQIMPLMKAVSNFSKYLELLN